MGDNGIRLAKVVHVHPSGYSVDLMFYDDNSRASNVQCMAPCGATTNTGMVDLPKPDPVPEDWSLENSNTRDMIAVVAFFRGQALVLGFLYPQVCQMLFDEHNRMVYRHASDVYTTIDGTGNLDVVHPSGTFVRIGTETSEKKMAGADFDGKWNIPQGNPVNVHIEVVAGGAVQSQITLKDNGEVLVDARNSMNVNSDVKAKIKAEGDIYVETGGDATVKSGGDALVEAGGRGQFVANGHVLIRSKNDRITLKSASGLLVI